MRNENNSNRAIFLDLNGTLVMPVKPDSLSELELIPNVDKPLSKLVEAGFACVVVTVQSRIAKGFFSEAEFRKWFDSFFNALRLNLHGPYVCPHRFSEPCACKKPNPILYQQAAQDLSLELTQSYVIGDSVADILAAKNIGGLGCFVRTGWGRKESEFLQAQPHAAFIGDSIEEIAEWILLRG